uniref:Substrate-binding domain-containing protein n=1 Tax=Paenibacillus polymyxa TaxID=1406 RepID=A0AAE9PRD5_PAEPO
MSGTYLLPTLMAKFAERYPDCRIQLDIQSPDAIKQLLKQGEIDFAFLDDRDSLPEYTVAEPVASDQVGVIRSATAPAYKLGRSMDPMCWTSTHG